MEQVMSKETGGPAFPGLDQYVNHPSQGRIHRMHLGEETTDGMTLRDYFAAKVIQGLWADSQAVGMAEDFALRAYQQADAMLAARNA
jgi:hypothetical protein